jgi:hypothetical protein
MIARADVGTSEVDRAIGASCQLRCERAMAATNFRDDRGIATLL